MSLSVGTAPPAKLHSQYTKLLTKCYGLKAFVVPNFANLIAYLEHKGKEAFCSGRYTNDIYRYIDIIGAPITLNCSVQHSNYFDK